MTLPNSNIDSKLSAPIDLGRVRQLFARPHKLVESEFLRREISARMQERLALVKITPQHILDAGCGAGADVLPLQKRFPSAQVLGIDAAAAMVNVARTSQTAARSSLNKLVAQWLPVRQSGAALICGDFARLPLAKQAVDLVWSNLAVHWHPSPDQVFAEWRRVLRVDGLLMFSCFGPDTFKELREAFGSTELSPHVLPFVDMHDFGDMLVEAGFSTPVMDMETLTVTYQTVDKLLADVRALGGNPLATRRPTLTGRRRWQQMIDRLEQSRRPDGTIALTFEVIYGHAFRPAPRTTARGESVIRLDFPKRQ
ncbi:methyltransferase domain-containing protein [Actimicrobium antarcticum]|uniref:methyltransferase domain-containing protein n=1 Tax=Actimicrobium antarcticum TaxID=1051899 RepID=UPI0031CF58EA